MAELTQQERLQPSLLDRLTDNERDKGVESRNQRVLSQQQLKQCVLRDLTWLLNTGNNATDFDFTKYPQIENSVLNYGMPDLTGLTTSNMDGREIERAIKKALCDYEPRILKNTVKIGMVVDSDQMNHNAVVFEIEGELWGQPVPLKIFLKTELDLETGQVNIKDSGSGY